MLNKAQPVSVCLTASDLCTDCALVGGGKLERASLVVTRWCGATLSNDITSTMQHNTELPERKPNVNASAVVYYVFTVLTYMHATGMAGI